MEQKEQVVGEICRFMHHGEHLLRVQVHDVCI